MSEIFCILEALVMGQPANLVTDPAQDLTVMGSLAVYRGLQSELACSSGFRIRPISYVPFKEWPILLAASAWHFFGLSEK